MIENIVGFVIVSLAIGYWAWVLVWSGAFIWGRDCLDNLQNHCHSKEWWFRHRTVKFIRDMLHCPYCTAFHLAAITQVGFWLFTGLPLNLLPSKGWVGDITTWFALACIGGLVGWWIGILTGSTWHFSDEEWTREYEMRHGRKHEEVNNDEL